MSRLRCPPPAPAPTMAFPFQLRTSPASAVSPRSRSQTRPSILLPARSTSMVFSHRYVVDRDHPNGAPQGPHVTAAGGPFPDNKSQFARGKVSPIDAGQESWTFPSVRPTGTDRSGQRSEIVTVVPCRPGEALDRRCVLRLIPHQPRQIDVDADRLLLTRRKRLDLEARAKPELAVFSPIPNWLRSDLSGGGLPAMSAPCSRSSLMPSALSETMTESSSWPKETSTLRLLPALRRPLRRPTDGLRPSYQRALLGPTTSHSRGACT